jgi:UDP-N-acetylglucosamine 2-epimerase (non-hydrolysing)
VGAARGSNSGVGKGVAHVVGARPNFVKAAPVWRALAALGVTQRLIHTGQHYDPELSAVFFRDLGLVAPDVQLDGLSTADLEGVLARLAPELVIVYGDVDSTLAAALAARTAGLVIAHVEAGLRSFDVSMPEEVNRIEVDKRSDLLFATSPEALDNLAAEGIDLASVHLVGNPMIDTLLASLERLDVDAARTTFGVSGRFAVATVHRQSNVDAAADAARVVAALATVAARLPVLLPLHPRGRATLEAAGLGGVAALTVLPPLGYLEFLSLVRGAALVVTDSGGVQEETTMLDVPCLTLRANTERPITISHGTNRLVSADDLGAAVDEILLGEVRFPTERPPLWDGHAGERIADVIQGWLAVRRDTSSTIRFW